MKNKSSPLFTPIKGKRIFEEIADQIKSLIITGALTPGEKLPPERELSLQFNSGRMVIREALRILEYAGFISVRQGSDGGAFVRDLDTEVAVRSISDLIKFKSISLDNLIEARLSIESEIIEKVIGRITNEDLILIDENIKLAASKINKKQRVTNENLDFHFLLAKSTKNPIFEMMIQSVIGATKFYIFKLKPEIDYMNRVLAYHREIFKAIKSKDKKKAKQKMIEHLKDVNQHLFSLMAS